MKLLLLGLILVTGCADLTGVPPEQQRTELPCTAVALNAKPSDSLPPEIRALYPSGVLILRFCPVRDTTR